MKGTRIILYFARFAYTLGCLCFYIISLWLFGSAIWRIISSVISQSFGVEKLLEEVGLIIFSIAVVDVSSYLMTEEVLKGPEKSPKEVRRTFTKFVIIIITALSLEGLVLTIDTVKTSISDLIYPILLFVTATVLLVGLGIYQKLNAQAEHNISK